MSNPWDIGPRSAVGDSADLQRVLALPCRPPPSPARLEAMVELVTARLRRPDRPPGAPCGCRTLGRPCIDRLLPEQAWALWEMGLVGGLVGGLAVGCGKTGLNLLAPLVVPSCRLAVLLVPPKRVGQLTDDYRLWREHFRVPSIVIDGGRKGWVVEGAPVLHVVPYSKLSTASGTALLESLAPDLVVADEAHALKGRAAARTGRLLRYFATQPDTRLCCWSGTIARRSVSDFAHLAAFALGEGSPLPLDPDEVESWASHLDLSDWPAPAGALKALCAPNESARAAVRRRVAETTGVVVSLGVDSVPSELVLRSRHVETPEEVAKHLKEVQRTWVRPDGEEMVDALELARCLQQLVSGFYYRWRFPGDPPRERVDAWFAARKAWRRAVREKLIGGQPHLDSPALLARAAERAERGYVGELPTWHCADWPRWRDVRNSIVHVTEAVWVSDYLVRDAVDWLGSRSPAVAWYEHRAFGQALADRMGLPLHAGGPDGEALVRAERGDRPLVISRRSHGEGLDGLQLLFDEALVCNPPPGPLELEQLVGRLHRPGQDRDEVVYEVYRHASHCREVVDAAVRAARADGVVAYRKLANANVEWRYDRDCSQD